MLEAIRTHAQTWIAKVILALITVPFALWGIDSYFRGGGSAATVATVGDSVISLRTYLQELNTQRDSIQSQGGKVDIENPAFRKRVLDQLVDTRLIVDAALANGMLVSHAQVVATLQGIPAFQENGTFSRGRMEDWLRKRGMAEQELNDMLQQEMLIQQMRIGYGEGSVVPQTMVAKLTTLLNQEREVSEATFNANAYLPTVKIDDRSVEAEYNANRANYSTPPLARVQYVVLSLQGIASRIQVAEADAMQYFEANKSLYQEPEQRRASHILIKTGPGMSPSEKAQVKERAEGLLREIRHNPARFAEIAKQNSQDPGSAARGGDLGQFTREMMVKPFSDAAFALKSGEISNLVESDFGYHIIRLDAVTPASTLAFAAVKDRIVDDLKSQEAQRKYAELADRFSNLVYEKADSLEPAVKELGLSMTESGWISQNRAEPAVLMNSSLLAAVFAPEAVQKKQNTEAIEVAPNTLVAARVLEYRPAGVQPLADVAKSIREALAGKAARGAAIQAGNAALESAMRGQANAQFGAPIKVTRVQSAGLPPQAMKALFKLPSSKLPSYFGVETADGYRLYRLNRVGLSQAQTGFDRQVKRDMGRMLAQDELRAYMEYTKARRKIEINQSLVDKNAP